MVDKPRCDQLLGQLEQVVKVLDALRAVPKDAFLVNSDKIGSAKYHFVVAIEVCIALANHLIASERFRLPRDNADSLAVLAENEILPEDKLGRFAAMARFRNRLVHLYWAVDDGLVHDFLQHGLDDLRLFLKSVATFISHRNSG